MVKRRARGARVSGWTASAEVALHPAATSVTAGTIFDKTRTPLTVWFMACWLSATQVVHAVPSSCTDPAP
jgi:hypothetical protein